MNDNKRTMTLTAQGHAVQIDAEIIGARDIVVTCTIDGRMIGATIDTVTGHPTAVARIGQFGLTAETYEKVSSMVDELKTIIAAADDRQQSYVQTIRSMEAGHGHDADNAANV